MGERSFIHHYFLCLLCALSVCLLCACTTESQSVQSSSSPEKQEENNAGASTESGSEEGVSDTTTTSIPTYSLDEIQTLVSDFFIMRGDSFEDAESSEVDAAGNADTIYYYPVEGTEFRYAPTIDLTAGDVLVTTANSDSVVFYRSEGQGFFARDAWSITPYKWETINGVDIPENWDDLDDAAQAAFLSEALSPLGITLDHGDIPVAESPTAITYGEFSGTTYIENTVELNVPFYRRFVGNWGDEGGESTFECPVIKAREGYFIVDTSSLESGTYFFSGRSTGYMNYARLNVIA